MENQVPQSAIEAATKCAYDLECLRTGKCAGKSPCLPKYSEGENVLYLTTGPTECPYCERFGKSDVCTCPVHYALFHNAFHAQPQPES